MSLDDLAARSGVSRSLIFAYEKGTHTPRAETIVKLSAALGVLPSFFSIPAPPPEPAPVFMRHFRSKAGAKHVTAVHRQLPWVRNVVNIIEEYVVFPEINLPNFFPPSDPREITDEQIEEAAKALRRHWGLGDGVVRDVIKLVENNGCIVVPEVVDCKDIDAFSQWSLSGRPFLVANSSDIHGVRWRVDIAHELGHLVMHRMVDRRFIELKPTTHKQIEEQAFRFAGAFLMPSDTFRNSVPHVSLDNLLTAKQLWHLSVGEMLHRAEDLGMVDKATAQRMWKNRTRRGWHKVEPLDDAFPVERPRLLANAIQAILKDDPQHVDDLILRTGLEPADIARYCGIAEETLAPEMPEPLPRIRKKQDLSLG